MADKDLTDLTKDELQERARDAGIAVSGTKEELIERIESASRETAQSDAEGSRTSDAHASETHASGRASPAEDEVSNAAVAMKVARQKFEELSGLDVELISGVRRDDGEWIAEIQATEMRRIPPSSDVVGMYELRFADDQTVQSIKRTARGRRDSIGAS